MTNRVVDRNVKTYLMISLVVLTVALSWFRPIDNFTEGYLNNSIKSAGIIFGIARTINALVSVAQSAQVGVTVTVAPGELFDPVNDLIEQFSEVMMFSIASLAFQKILLEIAANWFFNVLVTISAIAFIAALVFRRHETTALKVFAILVIVRLFLSLVVLANSAIDDMFLNSQIKEGESSMRLLEKQAVAFSSDAINQADGAATKAALDSQILEIDKKIKQLDDQKLRLSKNITKLNMEIDAATVERPWWVLDFLSKDPEVTDSKTRIKDIENKVVKNESKVRDIETEISSLYDERECLKNRSRGESCSWFYTLSRPGDSIKYKVMAVTSALDERIDKLITLSALIVLRSIILPLFFWVLIFKMIKWVWAIRFQPKAT